MLLSSKTNHQGFLQVLYQMDQTKHLETRQKGTELSWRARGLHRRASFKDPAVFERLFEVTPRSGDERRVIGSLISGSRWGASLNRFELTIQASTRHEATRTVVLFCFFFLQLAPPHRQGNLVDFAKVNESFYSAQTLDLLRPFIFFPTSKLVQVALLVAAQIGASTTSALLEIYWASYSRKFNHAPLSFPPATVGSFTPKG